MARPNENRAVIYKAIKEAKEKGLTIYELLEITKKGRTTIDYNIRALKRDNKIISVGINETTFKYYDINQREKILKKPRPTLTQKETEFIKNFLNLMLLNNNVQEYLKKNEIEYIEFSKADIYKLVEKLTKLERV